ncbi:single-stranded DNA-binding protein [Ornithinimicrobium cerasi]|uniref:single-stranded DNA-binding protein n=1 Tax=Ornithinimicrobium cerasi TaxID=2248773 RepID=UPI000F003543|nr:single-stranded DNA-binding protein [Ornithinimicrobium cerasi]
MSNTITITGNLAGDPELRFTPGGDAVANFTVCDTPRRYNQATSQWEDAGDTLFLRCAIWREEAEQAAQTLVKGQRVTVTGKLKQRSWQTPEGENRTVVECDAESIAPHPKKGAQGGQQQSPGGFAQRTQAARVHQATSGSDHLAQPAYQPTPGGNRQQAEQPLPVRNGGGWGGQPQGAYEDPPF